MIHFDTTKASRTGHHSGLQRVSTRLLASLGTRAKGASWNDKTLSLAGREDWFLTPELFDEEERPGFGAFLHNTVCRKAAIFHDAIPLRHPAWTWPKSVERHPGYMARLAEFDLILAVSEASREELQSYWHWMGLKRTPRVEVIRLGADFDGTPRRRSLPANKRSASETASASPLSLLCVGIIEPRKNQVFLAETCAVLWRAGIMFELHIAGRVNPHFGKPLEAQLRKLAREFPSLKLHKSPGDPELSKLYAACNATVMPTQAEGCGLPLLESLWQGIPCIGSDIAPLRENAAGGACLLLPLNEEAAWTEGLRTLLSDKTRLEVLAAEAGARALPSWAECAVSVLSLLEA